MKVIFPNPARVHLSILIPQIEPPPSLLRLPAASSGHRFLRAFSPPPCASPPRHVGTPPPPATEEQEERSIGFTDSPRTGLGSPRGRVEQEGLGDRNRKHWARMCDYCTCRGWGSTRYHQDLLHRTNNRRSDLDDETQHIHKSTS
ncbi:hypothetical protein GUJ93_ZPchr0009g1869 [Zizania palustris]|uniref:Uncharacterized protein n=1 Tax=Zizania palustris TaxID=103762 RepID=A0A8J5RQ80_ZIZPA|nr:hypothetical protein GUJ93_ZPchr0009g1869 [Zizania palustris]